MFPHATDEVRENNDKFSPCSIRHISKLLQLKKDDCFVGEEGGSVRPAWKCVFTRLVLDFQRAGIHLCLIIHMASQRPAHLWKPYCGGWWGVWCRSQWHRPLLLQRQAAGGSPVSPQNGESLQVQHNHKALTCTHLCQISLDEVNYSISTMFFCISPSQGLCCSQECEFKPSGETCDEATDCQRASVCLGLSPLCPEPGAKENLTVCSEGTRVCLSGVRRSRPSRLSVTQRASAAGVKKARAATWDSQS